MDQGLKKIRDKFEILEELAGISQGVNNVLEALIIIGDRGTTHYKKTFI
jgi:hypothetical protein